jgi:hypothetical protein
MWEVRDSFLATLRLCETNCLQTCEGSNPSAPIIKGRDSLGDHQRRRGRATEKGRFICWHQHMNRLQ